MAVAFRIQDHPDFMFIRLPESFAATPETRLALVCGEAPHELEGGFIDNSVFAVKNAGYCVETFALQAGYSDVFLHYKTQHGPFEPLEKLVFHQSVFSGLLDLSKSTDIYLQPGDFAKPASLAVVAVYTGDRTLLKFWATYYTRLVAPSQLYVLDGSGASDTKNILPSGINVIRVASGDSDPLGYRDAANYFQRFLFSNYQWVVQTSSREILLHKHGISTFLRGLTERAAPVILRPERYFALTSEAFSASGEKPVATLPHMVSVSSAVKPVLASMPMNWMSSFEAILEQYAVVAEPGLWLVQIVKNKALPASVPPAEVASIALERPALEAREA